VPVEDITRSILVLRGQRVVLDVELATLYGVPTKALILSAIRELSNPPVVRNNPTPAAYAARTAAGEGSVA
jgi:hypothetical protein